MTIHEEIKTLKAQLEALEKIAQEQDQKKYPKKYEGYGELMERWKDLEYITGWFVETNEVTHLTNDAAVCPTFDGDYMDTFATENQARSALAMAQLSQLMLRVWGDWRPV